MPKSCGRAEGKGGGLGLRREAKRQWWGGHKVQEVSCVSVIHVKATAASRLPERDALLLPSDTLCCKEGVQQASEPGQCLLKCANPPTERESLDMRASVPGHV